MHRKITHAAIVTGLIDWEPRDSAVGEIAVEYRAEVEAEYSAGWDYDRGRWDVDNDTLTVDLLAVNWIGWTDDMIDEFTAYLTKIKRSDFFDQVWETVEI